jgi:hypothetical protein
MIVAGVLLGLIAFGVWFSWLNLTMFFAIMAVLVGAHSLMCKCSSECCEPTKAKPKRR